MNSFIILVGIVVVCLLILATMAKIIIQLAILEKNGYALFPLRKKNK